MSAVELDLLGHVVIPYVYREAPEADDKCHFNSLLFAGEYLFVSAHAFGGESFINRYDRASMKFDGVLRNVGSSIHGLAFYDGELFWISTKTSEIRSDFGYRMLLPRPGYARGFAMTADYFIVATSEFLARGDRHAGDSWIQIFERNRAVVIAEYHLKDTGSINDLRLLDEHDYAHWIEPFGGG
jgi:hypothetical protein